jgi:hypothetical protein
MHGSEWCQNSDFYISWIHMAGIHQAETPTQQMLLFSSKLMTFWPFADIILNLYDTNILGISNGMACTNLNIKNWGVKHLIFSLSFAQFLSVRASILHNTGRWTQNCFSILMTNTQKCPEKKLFKCRREFSFFSRIFVWFTSALKKYFYEHLGMMVNKIPKKCVCILLYCVKLKLCKREPNPFNK